MTLSISKKYYSFNEDFWEKNIPAYDNHKHKLTSVSSTYQGPLITESEKIAQYVNSLVLPIQRNIEKFYNCFKNIEKINGLFKEKHQNPLIDIKSLNLCLRPSSGELKERLWAVHVSDYLWPDGVMRPFLKTLGSIERDIDLSFTIHFSLGEMVRPHDKIFNWKYRDIAILTPLGELTEKLAGIYPYDSFIHGEWKISPKSILIIKKEIKVPKIYSELGIKIINYDPALISLRKIIKNQIIEQEGIFLKMSRNLTRPGSPAYLYGNTKININHPEFFETLLEENKQLSFGSDTLSLNNRLGYCFGFIRQLSSGILEFASQGKESQLKKLYSSLQFVYEKIKNSLTDQEQEQITRFLHQTLFVHQYRYCENLESENLEYPITDLLCNLNFTEFQEFKSRYPVLFNDYNEHIVEAAWSIKRWLMLGQEQGKDENLENIYRENLNHFFSKKTTLLNSDIIDTLAEYLEGQSERAELALYILNLPETRTYNYCVAVQFKIEQENGLKIITKSGGFFSTDYSADSIESVLSEYTKTTKLFGKNYILSTLDIIRGYLARSIFYDLESQEKLDILTKTLPIKLEIDFNILKNSHANALHAIEFTPNKNTENELYNTKMKNLGSLSQSLLLNWRIHHPIHKLWHKFNLEKEFLELFESEEDFWNSEKTFIEIYRQIKMNSDK